MKFGLWFEPERRERRFRALPHAPGLGGLKCRLSASRASAEISFLLDLTRKEVRDYIVESVGKTLDGAKISYVKWDMNRHMSDAYSPALSNQGEFAHRYIIRTLRGARPRIHAAQAYSFFESCSSGGNRFDLGMLCYSPQIRGFR